jgi:hypothetical protein
MADVANQYFWQTISKEAKLSFFGLFTCQMATLSPEYVVDAGFTLTPSLCAGRPDLPYRQPL